MFFFIKVKLYNKIPFINYITVIIFSYNNKNIATFINTLFKKSCIC